MKRFSLILVLVFSCSFSAFSARQEVFTIPYEDRSGKIMIEVAIGDNMYSFIFDTGASQTVVSDALLSNPLVHTSGSRKVGDSGGNRMETGLVKSIVCLSEGCIFARFRP